MWILVCGGNTHRSSLPAVSSVGQNRVSCCLSGCWALRKGLDVLREETRLLRKGVNASLQALPGVGVVRACWGVSSPLTGRPSLPCPCLSQHCSRTLFEPGTGHFANAANGVCYGAHFGAQSYLMYHVVALEVTGTKARKGGACPQAADRLERQKNICTQSLNCLGTTGAAAPPRGPEGPPREHEVWAVKGSSLLFPIVLLPVLPPFYTQPFLHAFICPLPSTWNAITARPPFAFPNSTSFSLDQLKRPFFFSV